MRRRSVEFDYWRHFIPEAPDLEMVVESGSTHVFNLEPHHMVQGARDPNTFVSPTVDLEKVACQRGWRMILVPITIPRHGKITPTINGFDYFVRRQFEGQDCFNYLLTNGTQESNVARVDLTVVRGYTYKLMILYSARKKMHTIMVDELEETELPKPTHELFTWYLTRPMLVWNSKLGRQQVEWRRKYVTGYEIGAYVYNLGRIEYYVKRNPTSLAHVFEDDEALRNFPIGDTDQLYVPTGELGKVELEATFYYGELMKSESRKITMDVSYMFGQKWWKSGNIQRRS